MQPSNALKRNTAFMAALFILLAGCVGRSVAPDQVEAVSDWQGIENLTRVENIFVASQPSQQALTVARERGVGIVVNLRGPDEELGFDEAAAAEAAGLDYYQVPVLGSEGLDKSAMVRVSQLVEAAGDAPVLVHCSSGNRVAGWLAVHLAENRNMTADESLNVARAAGLTKPGLESSVRAMLEKSQ